jgi:hypothetical protein
MPPKKEEKKPHVPPLQSNLCNVAPSVAFNQDLMSVLSRAMRQIRQNLGSERPGAREEREAGMAGVLSNDCIKPNCSKMSLQPHAL